MKQSHNITPKVIMVLMAVAFALIMFQTLAWAQCRFDEYSLDSDSDGFSNEVECSFLTFWDGSSTIQSCNSVQVPFCLNPVSKDLFVILNKATPISFITNYIPEEGDNPAYPLLFFYRDCASGGLAINTLMIEDCNQATCSDIPSDDRILNPAITQKAVRISESLDTSTQYLGVTQFGTPNDKDWAKVYTQNIINNINSVCANATECKDSTTPCSGLSDCIDKLKKKYIMHTTAHEAGHMVYLVPTYDRRYGNHYAPGSGTVMEQSVKYTSKGGKVTFYISDKFAQPADVEGLRLK